MTFTIDPAVSSLRLSGEVADVLELEPQRDGSLIAAYEGTIVADITDGVISFPGGSNAIARATRSYDPGDGLANYGGESETDGVFSVKIGEAAVRDFRFDLRSEDLSLTDTGVFAASGLDVRTTSGILEYDLRVGGDGDSDLDDKTVNNNIAGNATLRGEGDNRTLTIPIDLNLSAGEAELRFRGTLVATTGTGAPIDPNVVRIGDGTLLKTAQFTDADGTLTTVTLTGGGSADVRFANAAQQTPGKLGTVIVGGTGVQLLGIDAAGTTTRTKIAITGKGGSDGVVNVSSIVTDGAAKSLGGKGAVFTGNVTVNGSLGALTATRLTGAIVTADSIGTVKIAGDVTSSTITLETPFAPSSFALRSLAASGAFNSSRITTVGAIGTIKTAALTQSEIYSGVSNAAARFPVTTELLDVGAIAGVTTRAFTDTVIAADTLGKLKLGRITTSNAGVTFGLAADAFVALQATNTAQQTLKLTATDDPSVLAAMLAAQAFDAGDFEIRLM